MKKYIVFCSLVFVFLLLVLGLYFTNSRPVPKALAANNQTQCPDMYPLGVPVFVFDHQTLCNTGYVTEYNNACKIAYYSANIIRWQNLNNDNERSDDFLIDPRVKNPSTNRDYARSGYDRGHLAPAGDLAYSKTTMDESFLLSNMVPQIPDHNRKTWRNFEVAVRKLAKTTQKDLFVVTGTVFDPSSPIQTIGDGVCVPHKIFKLVIDMSSKKYFAVISDNSANQTINKNHIVTLEDLEKITSIKFFDGLTQGLVF